MKKFPEACKSPLKSFAFSEAESHRIITDGCLRYLLNMDKTLGKAPNTRPLVFEVLPLALFALQYWAHHYAIISRKTVGATTQRLTLDFC